MSGRVLVCGAWDSGPGYPRAESLLAALAVAHVDVEECSVRMPWQGAGKRRLLRAPWRWPLLLWSLRRKRRQLCRALVQAVKRNRPDAILVPYPGHLLVGEVARATDIPVVLDLFLSAHDTVVGDRGLLRPGSLAARLLRRLDHRACLAADLVLLDTEENAQYVARLTGLRAERLAWVPVSDPAAPAQPAPYKPPVPGERLELLFFGTGVPLHGLSTLLGAVARSAGIRLTLVGGSPEERALARELPDEKLDLKAEFVDRSHLQTLLDRCHLVAGIFGTSAKAGRVVPFKVVHALASARPVLTAETSAVRGLLRLGEEVLTCRAGDVRDLVRALGEARSDPSRLSRVAQQGRVAYDRCFGVEALASRLCALLSDLTGTAMGEAMPSRAQRPSALVEVRP